MKKNNTTSTCVGNNKAFTLIELLAVIIILGILLIVAIPSVTSYISGSKKSTYVHNAKILASGAKNLINSGKLKTLDTNVTYYIDSRCIKTENANRSPYGDFAPAYIVVNFDGNTHLYYWTSRDTTGQGVKKITSINDLTEESIIPNIEKDEIVYNLGLDGREYYQLIDENCTQQEIKKADGQVSSQAGVDKYICKRAAASTLHKEKCNQSSRFCASTVGKNNYTTFGQVGSNGVLSPGDAFDCDVNGDDIYDPVTERFYYVSDYLDTKLSANGENIFNHSYAVLVYYTNYNGGITQDGIAYNSANNNYKGPVSLVNALPTTSAWKGVHLKETKRQILSEYLNKHNQTVVRQGANGTDTKTLPTEFSYEGHAARLLTVQEVMTACGITETGDGKQNVLMNCLFLFENTKYSDNSLGTYGAWLETPYGIDFKSALRVNSERFEILTSASNATNKGARPAIEVEKIYIAY